MHEIALDLLILLGGVWLVAVECNGEIIMDLPSTFVLAADDDIYVCGTVEALNRFYDSFQQDPPPLAPAAI